MSSATSSKKEKSKEAKEKRRKEKRKEKGKEKEATSSYSKAVAADASEPSSAYKPPEGAVLRSDVLESEIFDYDSLKNDEDLELWLIRVPEGITAKQLHNQEIPVSSSSHTSHVGTISRKHATYDIWSLRSETLGSENRQSLPTGGEEILGLTCLLPRKKKNGKLHISQVPFAQHIVLSAQPSLPTPPTSPPEASGRYCHPDNILKHRFLPTGSSRVAVAEGTAEMDVDSTFSTGMPVSSSKTRANVVQDTIEKIMQQSPTSKEVASKPIKRRKVDVGAETQKKTKVKI